ncbi:MAG TPA: hypothetical protein VG165_01200 [Solirubrobacteraceae bacterium]|nr:hypothetical protein [Solirubrobacteraceae bacterium]
MSQCESCGRRGKVPRGGDEDAKCEFCGGRLQQVWGLGQLAHRARFDRGPGSSPQLHETQVREALYGRRDQRASDADRGSSAEPEHETDGPVESGPEA